MQAPSLTPYMRTSTAHWAQMAGIAAVAASDGV
jgi:hypothetical protein